MTKRLPKEKIDFDIDYFVRVTLIPSGRRDAKSTARGDGNLGILVMEADIISTSKRWARIIRPFIYVCHIRPTGTPYYMHLCNRGVVPSFKVNSPIVLLGLVSLTVSVMLCPVTRPV